MDDALAPTGDHVRVGRSIGHAIWPDVFDFGHDAPLQTDRRLASRNTAACPALRCPAPDGAPDSLVADVFEDVYRKIAPKKLVALLD